MRDVNRLTLFVHENPGYASMFLNYHGSAYISIGSLEEHTDPDLPIQTQEIHYFLTWSRKYCKFSKTIFRLLFRSEISQKLDEQENCAESKFQLDLTCVEKFIEETIGCKIPWVYPETGNFHCNHEPTLNIWSLSIYHSATMLDYGGFKANHQFLSGRVHYVSNWNQGVSQESRLPCFVQKQAFYT